MTNFEPAVQSRFESRFSRGSTAEEESRIKSSTAHSASCFTCTLDSLSDETPHKVGAVLAPVGASKRVDLVKKRQRREKSLRQTKQTEQGEKCSFEPDGRPNTGANLLEMTKERRRHNRSTGGDI